jgi:hypothetical protein
MKETTEPKFMTLVGDQLVTESCGHGAVEMQFLGQKQSPDDATIPQGYAFFNLRSNRFYHFKIY